MTIDAQTIITAAALLAAIVAILKYYNKAYDLVKKQSEQDKEIDNVKKEVHEIKEEQQLHTYGILACLKGLSEQGCDGAVTDAINKIEKHLNAKAHS